MAPGIDVSQDSPLAGAAMRSGLLSIEDGEEAERDLFLDVLNHFSIKYKQVRKSIFRKNAAMQDIPICFIDVE